jgi:hypothetical protein
MLRRKDIVKGPNVIGSQNEREFLIVYTLMFVTFFPNVQLQSNLFHTIYSRCQNIYIIYNHNFA